MIFGYLCCLGVMVASIAAVAMSLYLVKVTEGDEEFLNLHNRKLSFTSVIYYQDRETGEYKEYQRLDGTENRIWVNLDDIPQHVQDAYIAVEDKDFYSHHGVNITRTIAAMINEYTPIKLFSSKTGASTITQQLVKNLTMDNSGSGLRGALRKVREIFRAFVLEKQYTKEEILEAYLNTLRLSNDWAGVQAGANNYFGKDVSQLSIAEAALLAGITKNPSAYNPYTNMENSLERRNDILYFMHEQGRISTEEYEAALAEEVVLDKSIVSRSSVNSYFTDMVIDQVIEDLMEQYGKTKAEATEMIYNEGLRIYSTVDPVVQSAMEEAMLNDDELFPWLKKNTKLPDGTTLEQTSQAAMVSVDYEGRVVGCVGGLGEKTQDRILNRALEPRQTGSTMKPIGAYAPALDYQYINYSYSLYDDWVELRENPDDPNGEKIEWPRNYSRTYSLKQIPVVDAIKTSLNTIAVRTARMLTPEVSMDFLVNTLHISTIHPTKDLDLAPLALGGLTYGVSPLEMAAAYAIFGNEGKYTTPHCYTTVEDADGEVILETKVTTVQAISEETAYIINRALRTVLYESGGTSFGLQTERMDSVGKTGTSSDDKDHWFCGVTPYYSTAVWWGYDTPDVLPWKEYAYKHPPTRAWRYVMNQSQKELPLKSFNVPSEIEVMEFCGETGDIANANCPEKKTGYYTADNMPPVCQTH